MGGDPSVSLFVSDRSVWRMHRSGSAVRAVLPLSPLLRSGQISRWPARHSLSPELLGAVAAHQAAVSSIDNEDL